MKIEDLEVELKEVLSISSKTYLRLKKNKIKTAKDLLYYFPYKYQDLTKVTKIKDLKINQTSFIIGKLSNVKFFSSPVKRMFLIYALVSDETGSVKAVWFNQPFLIKHLKNNRFVALIGKLTKNKFGLTFQSSKLEVFDSLNDFKKKIIPVYKEIEGLKSKTIEKLIFNLLEKINLEDIEDPLSLDILKKFNYPSLGKAILTLHKPKDMEKLSLAEERLSLEELIYWQIAISQERKSLEKVKAPIFDFDKNLTQKFLSQFNFKLTPGQIEVLSEIFKDLKKGVPMNRLLQGETGAGKTIISEIVALNVLKKDFQVVFMAPTEILAQQHFQRFLKDFSFLEAGLALLTSGQIYYGQKGFKVVKKMETILRFLKSGEIKILIGTHSLIENPLAFKQVGLIIIDEQQRFGILQRKKLLENTNQSFLPHFLSMTATPIPRTLALAFYGDLDFSYLKDKPFGQKPIKTFLISRKKEKFMWAVVKKEIGEGHQIFIVCPRVEEKEDEVKSVKEEFERVKKIFADYNSFIQINQLNDMSQSNKQIFSQYSSDLFCENSGNKHLHKSVRVAMLHGKMKSEEKEKILKAMQKNEIQILVSSSVVEVGIDLPLATVIIIQSPERFGLSQLYQLRGRVGRSVHQGYCFLVPQKLSLKSKLRLTYFLKAQSALELSEYDLKLRGAGELLGERQSGIPDLAMKALSNSKLIENAKKIAFELMKNDPELEKYPLLRKEVNKRKKLFLV
jgi:ATP-dependent DNA helicase RecG